MDIGTLVGILSGIALILSAILMGGDFSNFVNVPGLMIVFGGTISATLMTFPFKDVKAAFGAAAFAFKEKKQDPNKMVTTMLDICNVSRRQGLVALSKLEIHDEFLKKACNLIADGTKEDMMRDTLNIEIDAKKQRHGIIQDVFSKMAAYSPAFGMIGTLIGLIQMLQSVSNPETVGPAMSVALLTTFYGSFFATMFFNPMAGKLKARTLVEVINLEIMFEGAISILSDNNPMMVYEKLSSYIPAKLRKPQKK
ncbi:MAG: MotA/TolQ/ExbB proton channel family protein [Nitrospinota bacterium]|nr:MotA/TolQ/ExbB proton channel family protein [Nitrospinota bacterium]